MKAPLPIALSIAMVLAPLAQATEIRQFDRYDDSDEVQFVSKLVANVKAAAQNDPVLQAKVSRFFKKKQPGEDISGMGRFELNLSLARIADMDATAKSPHARRIEVEDVMYATLYNNGIRFTKSFRPTVVNFRAQKPLTQPSTRQDAVRSLAQTREWIARNVAPEHKLQGEPPGSKGWSGFSDDQKAIAFWAALIVGTGILVDHLGIADSTPSTVGSSGPPPEDPNKILHDAHQSACSVTLDHACKDPFGNRW